MSIRLKTAAAACAVGVAAGVATVSPASAANVGTAVYDCGQFGITHANFGRLPSFLSLVTDMTLGDMLGTSLTADLDGASLGPTAGSAYGRIALYGPFPTLASPPAAVTFNIAFAGGAVYSIPCTYIAGTQTGTWPV
ncbi:MAG: hypothetical protein HOU01_16105 [Streptomycetaceae bacterium]|nr:hypothetical protein [Streptomycetaceae bacterium]